MGGDFASAGVHGFVVAHVERAVVERSGAGFGDGFGGEEFLARGGEDVEAVDACAGFDESGGAGEAEAAAAAGYDDGFVGDVEVGEVLEGFVSLGFCGRGGVAHGREGGGGGGGGGGGAPG